MERDFEILSANIFCSNDNPFASNSDLGEATRGSIQELYIFEPEKNAEDNNTATEEFKLKDPPDLEEILTTDKSSIPATSHNVSVINSACQQILKEMEHQLLTLLKKNRKEQEIVQHYIATNGKSSDFENLKRPPLKIAGMPYFKDKHGFIPPPNEDVARKKNNKKLLPFDFLESFPMWNPTEAKNLTKAVEKNKTLKYSEIDWMKISVTEMEGKYSPAECKSMWNLNLRPEVNRSRWGLKENKSLQEIAAKYNYQDWDKIADELGTGRTGLQCCAQYQTHKCPSEGKWSKEEDENLNKLVEMYRVKDFIPWTKVAWHFQHRSLKQCQERYAYHLGDIKKGAFTMEEDFVIVYLASKLKNFGEVARFLPNRVATQVRARYEYLVELSMPKFTKKEDELLTKLMVLYPKNWAKISEHFENRSKVQCRKRWGYLQRGIKLENDFESGDEEETVGRPTEDSRMDESDVAMVKQNLPNVSRPGQVSRRHPPAYYKLLEHLQHCHKFLFGPKPRITTTPEGSKKLVTRLKIIMKVLSVSESPVSSNFDVSDLISNCEFDNEDINLLKDVQSEDSSREVMLSNKFIPPNLMTLVGLRTIFLIWSKLKNFTISYREQPKTAIDASERVLYGDAKRLFKNRMKALFTFPILLSNIRQREQQPPIYKPKVRKTAKPLTKLQRKRHAKYMSETHWKKIEKSLSEKLPESCAEESPVESKSSKRKYTPRSKKTEVNDAESTSKRPRRSPRQKLSESSSKTPALYGLFTNK